VGTLKVIRGFFVAIGLAFLASAGISAQSFTGAAGTIDGLVVDEFSHPVPGALVEIQGRPPRFRLTIRSDARGGFGAIVPYGDYVVTATAADSKSSQKIYILPDSKTAAVIRLGNAIARESGADLRTGGNRHEFAGPFDAFGAISLRDPGWVTQPVNFTGLADSVPALQSQNAFTWTGTAYRLQGMGATDPYQPGFPVLLGDIDALAELSSRAPKDDSSTDAFASQIDLFVKQARDDWHGRVSSASTGSPLASDNLPSASTRGALHQSEHFNWLTRDNVQVGGPLTSRGDIFVSGTGQWDSRTIPVAAPGQDQTSRLLFGNARGRFQLTSHDQIDGQYSGSRIDNSNWSQPAGLEEWVGWRMMPTLDLPPYGMNGLTEVDHLDSIQAGWTHEFAAQSHARILQVRYQFLPAHLDTRPSAISPGAQSNADLLGGIVTGPAPFSNLAVRTRQQIASTFRTGTVTLWNISHDLSAGGSYGQAKSRNRFSAPSDLNLVTANGVPAYVIELNTPLDSRELVKTSEAYALDRIRLNSFLMITAGLLGDFSRGSLPAQSSPAGVYFPSRQYPAQNGLIGWNSVSPQVAFALRIPRLNRMVLRASYDRRYAPLAGQYLDFANPNSLSGLVYQWNDANGDGLFSPSETGILLRRFGGAFSSISPSLERPYADEFKVAAEATLPLRTFGRIQFYRRDEKNRIAAENVGVRPQAYSPVTIQDPGPDSIPNTFDDQRLTVWNQNPQTFGHDQYLLTNPPGLRMMYKGFTAELSTEYRYLSVSASFTAEKSYGPTNPGDGVLENDSGVVGALYQDPNTLINAANRDFFDRAFVGKIQTVSHLPSIFGGFDLANTVNYTDGLVFARQLLVTGLNQGPVLIATTVRGSPEGGNRAEYVLNWNLRLSRSFQLTWGRLTAGFDLMNVVNARNRIQESDINGPQFSARLPVAIEPARFARLGFSFEF
jgi:hypothetical protein